MPVTVVVGGQYGSEGKGKVAHYLAKSMGAKYAVRCGGSNSGHTVVGSDGRVWAFRHLPTAAILPDVKLAICAGSYIDADVLATEIGEAGISPDRLIIDRAAVLITREFKESEIESGLVRKIGSTGSGTGYAVAGRILRKSSIKFVEDDARLRPFVGNVAMTLRASLRRKERIILEGTQGFGLSPLHSGFFPHVTSRDTTAAAFVSEAGLSPFDVDDIALVIRAFPIRVAGNSGTLVNEISWDTINIEGNHKNPVLEHTTVTKKIRRVARFDPDIVRKAININQPTRIFINHLDYINFQVQPGDMVTTKFIQDVEEKIGMNIDFAGFSPKSVEVMKA